MADEAIKKPETIHVHKFADGKETPLEMHQKLAWGGARCPCGAPAVVRAISFAPFKEMNDQCQELLIKMAHANGGQVPMVEFTYGKFVKIGTAFACSRCKKDLAKAMSKKPSWVLCEFDYGPKPINDQVLVPGTLVKP